ncbi:MAG: formyltetrahydrofolate deformylase [Kiritimatiellae bacterium]|nr:formyltetrahydrofolate deformylase [Kiritimatiellia bacterium]
MNPNTAILLISCPDQRGIVAALSGFIAAENGNILHLDQHVDVEQNVFFARVEWELEGFRIPRERLGEALARLAAPRRMDWQLFFSDRRPRVAIFVSTQSHCLYDLLARHEAGELDADIPLVIGNHSDLRPAAERFGIPFHLVPVNKDSRAALEEQELRLLEAERVDTVVLARYMQILSGEFVRRFPNRIINIHHSFLPAFPGAKPYHSAHARGVKIVGATAHYVTERLDEGPIIEQDVVRVSHRQTVADLVRQGQDLEKIVLARAVLWHLQKKVLVYNNKTVIF